MTLKSDIGKRRFSLVPVGVLAAVVDVLEYGAHKYAPDNWQTVEDGEKRYYDALLRHLFAWKEGEAIDDESGLPHIAHVAANALFLVWFDLRGRGR